MSRLQRLFQFAVPQFDQGPSPVEERHRAFDAVNGLGQALGCRTGQCIACGQPLADHVDRAGQFHTCVERPVRRAA